MKYSVKFKTEDIEDWQQRLIDETLDLAKRHNKLGEVLFSDDFDKKVGKTQFNLMKKTIQCYDRISWNFICSINKFKSC